MGAVGGSIVSVSIAGRLFSVAADADASINVGGRTNEYQANGDGTARKIQTCECWSVSGVSLSIDDSQGDLEFLQDTSDSTDDVVIVFEMASGVRWRGKGGIQDKVERSTQSTTAALAFAGPDKLERQ